MVHTYIFVPWSISIFVLGPPLCVNLVTAEATCMVWFCTHRSWNLSYNVGPEVSVFVSLAIKTLFLITAFCFVPRHIYSKSF